MNDTTDPSASRSRRALLSAAAGAVAAIAATAAGAIVPTAALAADPDSVAKNLPNPTSDVTAIVQGTADTDAFRADGSGDGIGVIGTTEGTKYAGVVGLAGDASASAYEQHGFEIDAGVYGYANQTSISAGVVAEGPTALYAYGDWAVYADGSTVGVYAKASADGTAVHAHAGDGTPPSEAAKVALRGTVTEADDIGVQAYGRVAFPNRSGRVTISAGQASKAVTVPGMTASNFAYAVLNTSRSGVYVRAVVPSTGKLTIYLNTKVPAATSVAWLVLG